MPETRPLVDVERLIRAHLAGTAALITDLGAASPADAPIMSELDDTYDPQASKVLQLFRVTSTDQGTSHVERAVMQMNSYGPTKGDAWNTWAIADEAMRKAATAAHELGVVTAVERVSGPTWSPDPTTDGPRYTSSFAITLHPKPSG